jgi:hypothetical protein
MNRDLKAAIENELQWYVLGMINADDYRQLRKNLLDIVAAEVKSRTRERSRRGQETPGEP